MRDSIFYQYLQEEMLSSIIENIFKVDWKDGDDEWHHRANGRSKNGGKGGA